MPEKKVTRQQMNAFQRAWEGFKDFIRETIGELRKVTWPTPREMVRLTQIVVIVIVVMALLLGGLDYVFTQLFGLIFGG
ncbi:MAG TPA: preprotein translocase subunit SecE [Anaerolineales bacterium]|nr:preprotein translocase subunit SecE [Anaerolineales bacterium]